MSHKKLRPFIVKVSVLGYFPLYHPSIMNIYIYIYIYIYKFHRLGKQNILDEKIQNNKIRPIKVIFKNETDKINIIKHAFKLKESEFNKVGITHDFSIDQLIIQSDLIKKAKSNSTDDVK